MLKRRRLRVQGPVRSGRSRSNPTGDFRLPLPGQRPGNRRPTRPPGRVAGRGLGVAWAQQTESARVIPPWFFVPAGAGAAARRPTSGSEPRKYSAGAGPKQTRLRGPSFSDTFLLSSLFFQSERFAGRSKGQKKSPTSCLDQAGESSGSTCDAGAGDLAEGHEDFLLVLAECGAWCTKHRIFTFHKDWGLAPRGPSAPSGLTRRSFSDRWRTDQTLRSRPSTMLVNRLTATVGIQVAPIIRGPSLRELDPAGVLTKKSVGVRAMAARGLTMELLFRMS